MEVHQRQVVFFGEKQADVVTVAGVRSPISISQPTARIESIVVGPVQRCGDR